MTATFDAAVTLDKNPPSPTKKPPAVMFALPVEVILRADKFPLAVTFPAVTKLPPFTFAVATTCPAVIKLPPVTFPVVTCAPVVIILPPEIFAVVVILPVASTRTVFIDANLNVAFPSVLALLVSGRTFDPNDPLIIS